MKLRWNRSPRPAGARGITILEVTIAVAVVTTVLMASAGAFVTSLSSVESAQRRTRATVFLETVMENITAQPYDNLSSFNGNHLYDNTSASNSNYSVDVTVFTAALDLQEVQAVLRDLRTDTEITRVTTLRSRR